MREEIAAVVRYAGPEFVSACRIRHTLSHTITNQFYGFQRVTAALKETFLRPATTFLPRNIE